MTMMYNSASNKIIITTFPATLLQLLNLPLSKSIMTFHLCYHHHLPASQGYFSALFQLFSTVFFFLVVIKVNKHILVIHSRSKEGPFYLLERFASPQTPLAPLSRTVMKSSDEEGGKSRHYHLLLIFILTNNFQFLKMECHTGRHSATL